MRHVDDCCVVLTKDSIIKFEENRRKISFLNPFAVMYKKVMVDGCAIKEGLKCDNLLTSGDEREEYFVELKGTDVIHAIAQLEETIKKIGEYDCNRHSYVICTNVAPAYNTSVQAKQKLFKKQFNSELVIKEKQHTVTLNKQQ